MYMRLGDLLVAKGVLTKDQRDLVLEEQRQCHRPFGVLAETIFGVDQSVIEEAWAEQYASLTQNIDPSSLSPASDILKLIERRQAWQFGMLPIGFDNDELVIASTTRHLAKAMRFAGWRIGIPASFAVADPLALGQALQRHYPMAGLTADSLMGKLRKVS